MYAYVFILTFSQLFLYSSFRQHAFILKSISANFSLALTLEIYIFILIQSILQQYLMVGTVIILILEKTIP